MGLAGEIRSLNTCVSEALREGPFVDNMLEGR